MSTAVQLFNCNKCKVKFPKEKLKFRHGQIVITEYQEKDTMDRTMLLLVSVKAWRNLCIDCVMVEERMNIMHVKESNGSIIDLPAPIKWKKFCDEYYDIAEKYDFGIGKDAFKQHSPFTKEKSWYKYGAYKSFPVLSFFIPKSVETSSKNGNKNENKNEKDDSTLEYDTTGVRFSEQEFAEIISFMNKHQFAQVHTKTLWFKEKNFSFHMKNNGFVFRDPSSYDRFLGRVSKKAEKHSLFKGNAKLLKDWNALQKSITKWQQELHHMGTTKSISIAAAKDGLFAKDRRTIKGKGKKGKTGKKGKSAAEIIDKNLGDHKENCDDKRALEKARLHNAQKQTEILGDIGKGFGAMAMSMIQIGTDDIWSDLVVFITMEYEPSNARKSVLKIIEKNKVQFVCNWRVVMKQGEQKWPKDKKQQLINNNMKLL
eukprot:260970_1